MKMFSFIFSDNSSQFNTQEPTITEEHELRSLYPLPADNFDYRILFIKVAVTYKKIHMPISFPSLKKSNHFLHKLITLLRSSHGTDFL